MGLPPGADFEQIAVAASCQIGRGQARIKGAAAGVIECRTASDAALAVCRCDTAVGPTDAVPLAQMQAAIGGAASSIIWQPGGAPGQPSNVFVDATPTAALAAFGQLYGDRTFVVDGGGGPVTFPAGAWSAGTNPGKATLAGRFLGMLAGRQAVAFAIGATLAGFGKLRDMAVTNNATAAVYVIPDTALIEVENVSLTSTSAGEFLSVGAFSTVEIWLFDRSSVDFGAGKSIETTAATSNLVVRLFDATSVSAFGIRALVGSIFVLSAESSAAVVPAVLPANVTLTIDPAAGATAYLPNGGVPVWGAFPPTELQSAMDQAALQTVSAGYAAGILGDLAAQTSVMPGAAASTNLAIEIGYSVSKASAVSTLCARHTGDAANVAGQTVTYVLSRLTAAGVGSTLASSAALPTSAGNFHDEVQFTAVPLLAGDRLYITATPSAALTATVTDISCGVS